MTKKVIGIVANQTVGDDPNYLNEKLAYIMNGYVESILQVNALPILIPLSDAENVKNYMELVDGIVLAGGQDVSPELYGEDRSPLLGRTSMLRDKFEMEVLRIAIEKRKPVLAICRGAQLVNVYFNGTLYQDESEIADSNLEHNQNKLKINQSLGSHYVTISDKKWANILGKRLFVNSFHHQAIKKLGDNLKIIAKADDGVIEGFESTDYPITAFQWHPEMQQRGDKNMLKIFQDLINTINR